jgi:hypothetical protein
VLLSASITVDLDHTHLLTFGSLFGFRSPAVPAKEMFLPHP